MIPMVGTIGTLCFARKTNVFQSLVKFWQTYRMQVDYYSIYFNNEFYDFKQVAQGRKEELEVLIQPLFSEFIKILEEQDNE